MISALFSFLGGSAFRMIWGELSSWWSKREDHKSEMERMRLEKELADAQHGRDLEKLRLSHDLGIKEIEVQRDAIVSQAEANAYAEALKAASRPTGIRWVDAWNASVRPSFATVCLVLWLGKVANQGFAMDTFDAELLAVVAGFYFADRSLGKRGK